MTNAQGTAPVSFSYDSGHCHYDVLPVRDSDDTPEAATHVVFRDDGSLAGFAALCGWAWGYQEDEFNGRKLLPSSSSLTGAVEVVAGEDAVKIVAGEDQDDA